MKNILVIDTKAREVITVIYRLHNHNVIACSDGDTGFRICRRWKPDLIVCGDMVDMHRNAFAEKIIGESKQRPFLVSFTRIWNEDVFQSAYAQAIEWGFDICVQSPVNLHTLLLWARLAELRGNNVPFFPRAIR